jgi:hypothetical protein
MGEKLISSDREIHALIACRKEFVGRPSRPAEVNKNIQQRFSVIGSEDSLLFDVFITYSKRIPADFSIGLMCGKHLLLRVNGYHGTTRSGYYNAKHHAVPHVHILTLKDVKAGRISDPSTHEEMIGEYCDLFSARLYFFNRCGILGYEKYFDHDFQISVFDDSLGSGNDADWDESDQ